MNPGTILGTMLGRMFRRDKPAAGQAPGSTAGPAAAAPASPAPAQAAPAQQQQPVDIEAYMDELAAKSGQQLNWKTSIVDLMKLLDMDSSLEARKQLADELHYTGDKSDSAAMNIWLHKQVMSRVEANGGKVPSYLKD